MQVSLELLRKISPAGAKNVANMQSVVMSSNTYGPGVGLEQPHRLAHFLAQLAHESGDFRYDKEIADGSSYEGRDDLGNTKRGDGKRFRGRGPIQVTGRTNYTEWNRWVHQRDPGAPDFVKEPEKINTDPYEGLTAIWYWDWKKLNRFADQNDIEMITKRVNGGLNGFDDRKTKYIRAALAILGEPLTGNYVKKFQEKAGLEADGDPGPRTRAELHKRLVKLTVKPERSSDVQAAPVVEKQAVPVKLASLEGNTAASGEAVTGYAGVAGVVSTIMASMTGLDWRAVAAVAAAAVLAGLGYLIYKRWAMKQEQKAKVEQIESRSL